VYVPCDKDEFAKEGPSTIHSGDHVRFARVEDGYVVFESQSGTYEFNSKLSR